MRKNIQSLFNKLSEVEKQTFSGETTFLSPVVAGQPIRLRLEGIVLNLHVRPRSYEGWGIFKATSTKDAVFSREASLSERQEYLNLYPRFKCIIYRQDKKPFGLIKSQYKNTVIDGQVRVLLPDNISQFDVVNVRWDGNNFWYDNHDYSGNLANLDKLRESLALKTPPTTPFLLSGLTPLEIQAYALAFEDVKDRVKDRLENALHRSGSKLVKYTDRGNSYTVTYAIGNRQYTSTVDESLRVQSAGICLSGGDKNFDLQSLVHVIKEGERRDSIVVGDYSNYGYDGRDDYDDDY